MKKEYCCELMQEMIQEAGVSGFSVIPELNNFNETVSLRLIVRSKDYSDAGDKCFQAEVTLLFCPCCGQNLKQLINENKKEYLSIAEKNKHILNLSARLARAKSK